MSSLLVLSNPHYPSSAEDASPSSSPVPSSAKATPQSSSAPTRGTQKSRGPASRGGKYYQRGAAARSAPRDPNQPQAEDPVTENQRKCEHPLVLPRNPHPLSFYSSISTSPCSLIFPFHLQPREVVAGVEVAAVLDVAVVAPLTGIARLARRA